MATLDIQAKRKLLADLLGAPSPENEMIANSLLQDVGQSDSWFDQGPPVADQSYPMPPDDMLPPPVYRGESMSRTPQRPFITPSAAPAAPVEPEGNWIRNEATGKVTQLSSGPTRSTPALDYAQPVEIPGVGMAYRMKGDPFTAVAKDGTIIRLGQDTAATAAKEKEALQIAKMKKDLQPQPQTVQPTELMRNVAAVNAMPDGPIKQSLMEKLGMAASAKKTAEENSLDNAKKGVAGVLTDLGNVYLGLQDKGAMVDPKKSWVANLQARTAASGLGQAVGGAFGTEEQTLRDNIANMRPILINEIRKATQMGAKGMDSEKELQFYLQAATDPTKSIDANLDAIDRLNKAYGLGMDLGFRKKLNQSREKQYVEIRTTPTGKRLGKRADGTIEEIK